MTKDHFPRPKNLNAAPIFIGVDVAKYRFDGASSSGPTWGGHVRDMSKFVDWIASFNPQLVVLEASVGYERDLVARRRQLIEMRKVEKTRLDGVRTSALKTAITGHID